MYTHVASDILFLPALHYGIASLTPYFVFIFSLLIRKLFVNFRERTGICRYFISQSGNCTIMSEQDSELSRKKNKSFILFASKGESKEMTIFLLKLVWYFSN